MRELDQGEVITNQNVLEIIIVSIGWEYVQTVPWEPVRLR
jgi:hypothetical protein